ncbi:unnamed protein product, partial [Rhizoctonia solani]
PEPEPPRKKPRLDKFARQQSKVPEPVPESSAKKKTGGKEGAESSAAKSRASKSTAPSSQPTADGNQVVRTFKMLIPNPNQRTSHPRAAKK